MRRQANKLLEARGKRAKAGIAEVETDIGDTQRCRQQEPLRRIHTKVRQELAGRNVGDRAEYAVEMKWTQAGDLGHLFERERLRELRAHTLNHLLDGSRVGGDGAGAVGSLVGVSPC